MSNTRFALSTSDNPFDPFQDFERWFAFDESKGYNSSGLIARIAQFSSELSDADQTRIIESAIDSIVATNVTGNYIKAAMKGGGPFFLDPPPPINERPS